MKVRIVDRRYQPKDKLTRMWAVGFVRTLRRLEQGRDDVLRQLGQDIVWSLYVAEQRATERAINALFDTHTDVWKLIRRAVEELESGRWQ